jgi:hypothetical protein
MIKTITDYVYSNRIKSIIAVGICIAISACVAQRSKKKVPVAGPTEMTVVTSDLDVSQLPKPLVDLETYNLVTYTLKYAGEEYIVIEKNKSIAICKK